MKKFFILLCIFFMEYTSSIAQTEVWWVQDFYDIDNNLGGSYILMRDIDTAITSPIAGAFTGNFNGNNKKITVGIRSNATNVGLFSEIAGGQIDSLIIDGSVTGLLGSQNVGGLVGLMSGGQISIITNLAEVIGESPTSSVGGLVGKIENSDIINECINNGTIVGGQYVAGIVGYVNTAIELKYCKNAGTIRGWGDSQTCMAGIVGFSAANNMYITYAVNVGKILSSRSEYAGGIVGYFDPYFAIISTSSNSGIVDGAINSVGGIVGYIGRGAIVEECINTNWVEPLALYSGAIVGENNGAVNNCFYDEQICIADGIGVGNPGIAQGLQTTTMLGINLQGILYISTWVFEDNLYPRPICHLLVNHPINLLSAAPIYLAPNDKLDNVRTDFYVSNYESWGPPPFITQIESPYYFQWYSFSNGRIISISNVPLNNATINPGRTGPDTLRVILTTNPIYEKIVPVMVR